MPLSHRRRSVSLIVTKNTDNIKKDFDDQKDFDFESLIWKYGSRITWICMILSILSYITRGLIYGWRNFTYTSIAVLCWAVLGWSIVIPGIHFLWKPGLYKFYSDEKIKKDLFIIEHVSVFLFTGIFVLFGIIIWV